MIRPVLFYFSKLKDDIAKLNLAKLFLFSLKHHDLPGLVSECKGYFKEYQLPNILKQKMTKNKWKCLVKKAIQTANEKELK
jgi:hypothetical protein